MSTCDQELIVVVPLCLWHKSRSRRQDKLVVQKAQLYSTLEQSLATKSLAMAAYIFFFLKRRWQHIGLLAPSPF